MSLINDALKRARQVQNPSPAPHIPGPPAEENDAAPVESENRSGVFGTAGLVSVVLIGLALLWLSLRGGSHEPETVQARTQDVAVAPQKPSTPEAAAAAATAPGEPAPAPAAAPAHSAIPNTQPTISAVATAQATVVQPVPAPPPLKLQAVIFNPRRPSAIINGKTLFVGDRFDDMRVFSITADTVTLVGGGTTNRLRLSQ